MNPMKYLLRFCMAAGVSFIAAGCADIEVDEDDIATGRTRTTTTTVEETRHVPATTTSETVVRY